METAGALTSVAACAAAIAGFVALTVSPAARVAKLAWRLEKVTAKYGPKLVARSSVGPVASPENRGDGADRSREAASGVAALAACGI